VFKLVEAREPWALAPSIEVTSRHWGAVAPRGLWVTAPVIWPSPPRDLRDPVQAGGHVDSKVRSQVANAEQDAQDAVQGEWCGPHDVDPERDLRAVVLRGEPVAPAQRSAAAFSARDRGFSAWVGDLDHGECSARSSTATRCALNE
jgi:hypothetical protein